MGAGAGTRLWECKQQSGKARDSLPGPGSARRGGRVGDSRPCSPSTRGRKRGLGATRSTAPPTHAPWGPIPEPTLTPRPGPPRQLRRRGAGDAEPPGRAPAAVAGPRGRYRTPCGLRPSAHLRAEGQWGPAAPRRDSGPQTRKLTGRRPGASRALPAGSSRALVALSAPAPTLTISKGPGSP